MKNRVRVFKDCSLKYLPRKKAVEAVKRTLEDEGVEGAEINLIYFDDEKIRSLNKQFLEEDRATDVLAFKLNEEDDPLEGEIYVGAERALEQAKEYKVSFTKEILRLSVHGALHLLGYADNTEKAKIEMRKLEDKYILE